MVSHSLNHSGIWLHLSENRYQNFIVQEKLLCSLRLLSYFCFCVNSLFFSTSQSTFFFLMLYSFSNRFKEARSLYPVQILNTLTY